MTTADIVWKIAIGGAGGVGKTTIIHRFLQNEFINDTKMTVGVQFHLQHLERAGKTIDLVLWDMGGQERFRFMIPHYAIGSVAAFVLFDMSRLETLKDAVEWIELFRKCSNDIPIMFIGTKRDVVEGEDLQYASEMGNDFARKFNCIGYAETSAKFDWNVSESILYLVDYLLKNLLDIG